MDLNIVKQYDTWDSNNTRTKPDNQIAPGKHKNVHIVNTEIGVYDKGTGDQDWGEDLAHFWRNQYDSSSYEQIVDPQALYDKTSERFVVSAFVEDTDDENDEYLVIAASPSSGPGQSDGDDWHKCEINPSTVFEVGQPNQLDQPSMGMTQDAIILSSRISAPDVDSQDSLIVTIDKSNLYEGSCDLIIIDKTIEESFAKGVQNVTQPPNNEALITKLTDGENNDALLKVYRIQDPLNPVSSIEQKEISLGGERDDPPDAETPGDDLIYTAAARPYDPRFVNGSIWITWSNKATINNKEVAIFVWAEVSAFDSSNNFELNVKQIDSRGIEDEYWFQPSLNVDPSNNTMCLISHKSASYINPGFDAFQRNNSTPNSELEERTSIKEGESGISDDESSTNALGWGDYTDVGVDWDKKQTEEFWIYAMYAKDSTDNNMRGTRAAKVRVVDPIDDYEDNDISEYFGDTSWADVNQDPPVKNGLYSLKLNTDGDRKEIASDSSLDVYPQRGDIFRCWFRFDNPDDKCFIGFGHQSGNEPSDELYTVKIESDYPRMSLILHTGGEVYWLDQVSVPLIEDFWYDLEVAWNDSEDNNEIIVKLFANGVLQGEVSDVDSTHDEGGIAMRSNNRQGNSSKTTFDYWRLL